MPFTCNMNGCSRRAESNPIFFDPFPSERREPDFSCKLRPDLPQTRSTSPQSAGGKHKPSSSPFLGKFHVNDISHRDTGYHSAAVVVQPYEIEEPDDDDDEGNLTYESDSPMSPAASDNAERWHEDLVDSMQYLDCDSDAHEYRFRADQQRGRKRKPSNAAATSCYSIPQRTFQTASSFGDNRSETNFTSPKRLRRQRTKSKGDPRDVHGTFSSHVSNESLSPRNSTSRTPSTDTNTDEPVNETVDVDEMDVD